MRKNVRRHSSVHAIVPRKDGHPQADSRGTPGPWFLDVAGGNISAFVCTGDTRRKTYNFSHRIFDDLVCDDGLNMVLYMVN